MPNKDISDGIPQFVDPGTDLTMMFIMSYFPDVTGESWDGDTDVDDVVYIFEEEIPHGI